MTEGLSCNPLLFTFFVSLLPVGKRHPGQFFLSKASIAVPCDLAHACGLLLCDSHVAPVPSRVPQGFPQVLNKIHEARPVAPKCPSSDGGCWNREQHDSRPPKTPAWCLSVIEGSNHHHRSGPDPGTPFAPSPFPAASSERRWWCHLLVPESTPP